MLYECPQAGGHAQHGVPVREAASRSPTPEQDPASADPLPDDFTEALLRCSIEAA